MKNHSGKGVIRLGDKTSHGGLVISAAPDFIVLGKPVVTEGCLTVCPKCRGVFPVKVNASDREHYGQLVAYADDTAACGAKLISSV